jgi:uncharacterized membrane protein YoaK (UPF0700 family)
MPRRRNIGSAEATAVALGAVAGYLDVVGYLTLHHLFTAHMTGNASKLGAAIARGDPLPLAALVAAPALFVVAVAVGTVLADRGRRRYEYVLQAIFVACFMSYGASVVRHGTVVTSSVAFYVLESLAVLALGLQTAAFTEVAGDTTRTTYLSGMLTRLGQLLARGGSRRRLLLLAGLWFAYAGGATLGAYLLGPLALWCLAFPLAALLVVGASTSG